MVSAAGYRCACVATVKPGWHRHDPRRAWLMPAKLEGHAAEVGQAFAGAPQRVGWFSFYFEDQRWEWWYRPPSWCWRTSMPTIGARWQRPSTTCCIPTAHSALGIASSTPAASCTMSWWWVINSLTIG